MPKLLYPMAFTLAGGYAAALGPVTGPPPPTPPPTPPPPPSTNVVVSAATVELFGAMPRFGSWLTHGSSPPGSDWGGASSGNAPNPLLHAKTDQAHGTGCAWADDFSNSADSIPGCPQCKDEGAIEPFLTCSYDSGPGAYGNFDIILDGVLSRASPCPPAPSTPDV